MKPKLIILITLLSLGLNAEAQDSTRVKTNPIIFANLYSGVSFAGLRGGGAGFQLTGGFNKNLFSLRYGVASNISLLDFALIFPLFTKKRHEEIAESGLMYGRQFVSGGRSFNLLAGVSYNHLRKYTLLGNTPDENKYFAGIPFEASVMWFKSEKRRFKILGLVPVGGPTGFGWSAGFKLYGNISQRSYVGLGAMFGLGLHKQYDDE